MEPNQHFHTVIIGCGMSGLAAGIRLAMFGHDVIILERHNAPGGLNSFYSFDGRKYDVGLHAVTNYVPPGVKGRPLTKLLRQLRIPREAFDLAEQVGSKVAFPGVELNFTNDFSFFESEVERAFPTQIDKFRRLVAAIQAYHDVDLEAKPLSAREKVREFITDRVLEDMLFCPVMYYGSSQENDMEFGQFAIMFKSLFCEGFARPFDGVRKVIRALLDKYRSLGGKRKMKCGVQKIVEDKGQVAALVLDNGDTITADHVLSSAGLVETMRMCGKESERETNNVGRLSFVETITVLKEQPRFFGWEDTIIFFNDSDRFFYQRPDDFVDPRSGVICFPNNYRYENGQELEEGFFRVTAMANYALWKSLGNETYREKKDFWFEELAKQAKQFLKPVDDVTFAESVVATDMFTPTTVEKFTSHINGAIYGATHKVKNGQTHLDNLYLCGTDQGFLGIIGAMLSGISMANLHVLKKS